MSEPVFLLGIPGIVIISIVSDGQCCRHIIVAVGIILELAERLCDDTRNACLFVPDVVLYGESVLSGHDDHEHPAGLAACAVCFVLHGESVTAACRLGRQHDCLAAACSGEPSVRAQCVGAGDVLVGGHFNLRDIGACKRMAVRGLETEIGGGMIELELVLSVGLAGSRACTAVAGYAEVEGVVRSVLGLGGSDCHVVSGAVLAGVVDKVAVVGVGAGHQELEGRLLRPRYGIAAVLEDVAVVLHIDSVAFFPEEVSCVIIQ